jgi:hypothetical protein
MATKQSAPGAASRQARKLSELAVEGLRPPASGRVEIRDGMISGLSLRITDLGVKTWATGTGRKAVARTGG